VGKAMENMEQRQDAAPNAEAIITRFAEAIGEIAFMR
jgi:hypothetical protein